MVLLQTAGDSIIKYGGYANMDLPVIRFIPNFVLSEDSGQSTTVEKPTYVCMEWNGMAWNGMFV